MTIHNYDDWLKLPENYRQRLLSEWNAYEHEMFWGAYDGRSETCERLHLSSHRYLCWYLPRWCLLFFT